MHETWEQSKLLKSNGQPVGLPYRVRWTIIQSARPLLVADGTTAFSLFISCASPLPAIFQFGLCGGVLIVTNFFLVLVYMPSLLVLEERGAFKWFWAERFGSTEFKFHERLHRCAATGARWAQ